MPRHTKTGRQCIDCGADISQRGATAKRCIPCQAAAKRAGHRAWLSGHPIPRYCLDCGTDISGRSGAAKRCAICSPPRTQRATVGVRVCADCGENIANRHFNAKRCPTCAEQRDSAVYLAHQRRYRLAGQRRAWKHHTTISTLDAILATQGGRCPGCGKELSWDKSAHVDHDHACCPGINSCGNCIRGILCAACNIVLGGVHDDPAILRNLLRYLEAPEPRVSLLRTEAG